MSPLKRIDRPRPGFDFTARIRPLCADLVRRLPELFHVDLGRVAIGFSQVRNGAAHGVLATLTPLRFADGASTTLRRGRAYTAQRLFDAEGREMLYILNFFLPRFMNYSLEEKVNTVIHELWHINPACNGDIRRFAGRCYAHGHSQQAFDEQVSQLSRKWWAESPPVELYDFLQLNFQQLQARHGTITGVRFTRPKLIPVG